MHSWLNLRVQWLNAQRVLVVLPWQAINYLYMYGIALHQQINRWCLNTDSSALQLHILRLVSLLIPIALQAEYWPLSNLFHRTL